MKRGDCLVTLGGCRDCHTPQRDGQRMMELDFAGGYFLRGPFGEVASTNITPAPSGIPYYDERLFMDAIRTGWVKARKLSQIMPCASSAGSLTARATRTDRHGAFRDY